jgi:hypothetical protein
MQQFEIWRKIENWMTMTVKTIIYNNLYYKATLHTYLLYLFQNQLM